MSYSKYYIYKKQYSTDGGETWYDVSPAETAPSGETIDTYDTIEECENGSMYKNQYFTIVPKADGYLKKNYGDYTGSFYYSYDSGATWNLGEKNTDISMTNGQKIMFKGNMISDSTNGVGIFSSSTQIEAEGNPMSLIFDDNFSGETSLSGINDTFSSLFAGCTMLTSIDNLVLPAAVLGESSYRFMFEGCTSLTSVPRGLLPATTLGYACYSYMFSGCTSLTTAPSLPETTLAGYCYHNMFEYCTSLTTAPSLPATTLAEGCYEYMFYRCSSLTTAPELPATTLAGNCYAGMFQRCTSLTTAPSLPATTLYYTCYGGMFGGCTSLTTAPTLPATTLASWCYNAMFQNCSSLKSITCLAISGIDSDHSTDVWIYGVGSTGTFYKKAGATWPTGGNGIPDGWTVVEI